MGNDFQFSTGFGSDNHSGVHPKILQALTDLNYGHAHSYGMDEVSQQAAQEFARHFGDDIDVHYVFNGTAANVLCLNALIKSYEAVICADQAHLHLDECAAPEKHLGCKLIPLPTSDGKIRPEQVKQVLKRRGDQHHAQPRAISITQPTEVGTVYSLEEMKALGELAQAEDLFFHVDGARLVNAAVHLGVDLKTLTTDMKVDALSLGGTKNGLLGAEAVILFSRARRKDFKFLRKQAMQLPSKMRFISGQFLIYLQGDLWQEIAQHSTSMATRLHQILAEFPEIQVCYPVQSNALFVRIPKAWTKALKKQAFFYVWDEDQWIMRWMMSFDTTEEQLQNFASCLRDLKNTRPVESERNA